MIVDGVTNKEILYSWSLSFLLTFLMDLMLIDNLVILMKFICLNICLNWVDRRYIEVGGSNNYAVEKEDVYTDRKTAHNIAGTN